MRGGQASWMRVTALVDKVAGDDGADEVEGCGLTASEEGARRHQAPNQCEEGPPWRKKVARRRWSGGAPLLWIEHGGGGAR